MGQSGPQNYVNLLKTARGRMSQAVFSAVCSDVSQIPPPEPPGAARLENRYSDFPVL